jgi:hypothetical protein
MPTESLTFYWNRNSSAFIPNVNKTQSTISNFPQKSAYQTLKELPILDEKNRLKQQKQVGNDLQKISWL